MNNKLLRKMLAEFIGTFTLVFSGCGTIMLSALNPGQVPGIAIPLAFGLAITVMIYAVGHISGGHFNPAVSLGFAAVNKLSWRDTLAYWLAQSLGAIAAIAILSATLPDIAHYGVTFPSVPPLSALVWEAILTFFLMFVIISVATDKKAFAMMSGVAIGATIVLDAIVGGHVTGASMNPARSLAPALFAGEFADLWIYIVAPAIGASFAALTYQSIRSSK